MVGGSSMDNGGMVGRGSMNNGGMVGRGGMDNRGSMDYWGMVCRSIMNSWCGSIAGDSFIGDILDVSRVSISAIVDHLSPAIRKSHPVGARGGVSISLLLLSKVSSTVVITHSVLVSIQCGLCKVRGGIPRGYRGCRGSSKGSGEDENLHV